MISNKSDVKSAVDLVNELKTYIADKQLEQKYPELEEMVSKIQDAISTKQGEKGNKKALTYGKGAYFEERPDGSWSKPFCKDCYEKKGKKSDLILDRVIYGNCYYCNHCDYQIFETEYAEPKS